MIFVLSYLLPELAILVRILAFYKFRATVKCSTSPVHLLCLIIDWMTIDWSVQSVLHSSWQKIYFTIGDHFPQYYPFSWGSGPPFNSWLLRPVRAHNRNGITIGSDVFAQVTAECPHALQWVPLSQKIALPMADMDPHLTHDFLSPFEP